MLKFSLKIIVVLTLCHVGFGNPEIYLDQSQKSYRVLKPTSKSNTGLIEKFQWILTRHGVEKSIFLTKLNQQNSVNRVPASTMNQRRIKKVSRGIASVLTNIEQKQSPLTKLQLMNTRINGLTFKTDSSSVGESDYWASPLETLQKGSGDCEDLAILKMFTLKEQYKFSSKDLYLVMAYDLKKKEKHAFTLARLNGKLWVLDNQVKMQPIGSIKERYRMDYIFQLSDWL